MLQSELPGAAQAHAPARPPTHPLTHPPVHPALPTHLLCQLIRLLLGCLEVVAVLLTQGLGLQRSTGRQRRQAAQAGRQRSTVGPSVAATTAATAAATAAAAAAATGAAPGACHGSSSRNSPREQHCGQLPPAMRQCTAEQRPHSKPPSARTAHIAACMATPAACPACLVGQPPNLPLLGSQPPLQPPPLLVGRLHIQP